MLDSFDGLVKVGSIVDSQLEWEKMGTPHCKADR